MFRGLARAAVWMASLVFFPMGAAMANGIPLGTETLTLLDGSTVTGYFTLDTATNTLTSWDFTTTAGTLFGAETFNSADAAQGASGTIVTNSNGDEVLSFGENQTAIRGELDLVIACGGTVNCLTNANLSSPQSFALNTGPQPSPCPGLFCIPSGLQSVPEGVGMGMNPGFLNVSDPNGQLAFNIDSAATGTVFNGGGGNNTGVPEPSTLLLSALGLGALALKRFYA